MGNRTHSDVLRRSELDRALAALSRHPRRQILTDLYRGRITHVDDVALRGLSPGAQAIQLRHSHLPALVEAGFIEWHPETGAIERGPRFGAVATLLELFEDHADELPGDWP